MAHDAATPDKNFRMYSRLALEKPSAEFLRQPRGKLLQQLLPIFGPLRPLLLMLDNTAADLEVGQHLKGVDRGGNGVARGLDETTEFGDERCEFMGCGRDGLFFHRDKASCN